MVMSACQSWATRLLSLICCRCFTMYQQVYQEGKVELVDESFKTLPEKIGRKSNFIATLKHHITFR